MTVSHENLCQRKFLFNLPEQLTATVDFSHVQGTVKIQNVWHLPYHKMVFWANFMLYTHDQMIRSNKQHVRTNTLIVFLTEKYKSEF